MAERLSDLYDGHHAVWAYCQGRDGGPPCGHRAKLDLGEMIARYGDISPMDLRRRLECPCGARATISTSNDGRVGWRKG